MSAYTLTMSDEVEKNIQVYQHETNVKEMLKKIKGVKSEKVNAAATSREELTQENLAQPLETALEQMNESVEQTQETINHS